MITLYAAVGNIATWKSKDGKKLRAVVVRKGLDFEVNPSEFILWTTAIWNIYHYDELRQVYEAKVRSAGLDTMDFDVVLEQLLKRKLLIRGAGKTGIDALYELLMNVFLEPFQIGLMEKIISFFRLVMANRVPIKVARNLFVEPKLTRVQKEIWKLIRQRPMSTAELIRCIDLDVRDISTSSKVVERLYSEEDGVNYKNIGIHSRLSDQQFPVLDAVTNLYLEKQITLDICE